MPKEEKAEERFCQCPVCGNLDTELDCAYRCVTDCDDCDEGIVEHCSCMECGTTWDIVYRFERIVNIREGVNFK